MLSEVAIDNPKYFAELVKMAENANNGVAPKAEKAEKKVETVKLLLKRKKAVIYQN